MKEVLGSLPEVITAYKNYNLLVPTATDVQLNPFYKFHVEEVPVDLGENSGDIFKVGSVKTGKQDEKGKDIWEDVFSLSKPLLNKMAMAAGIQFNPKETYEPLVEELKQLIHKKQYHVLKVINAETINLYWEIGEEIYKQQQEKGWGKSIVQVLSRELQKEFPGAKGYSAANLWRMRNFYLTYRHSEKLAPMVREISWSNNIIIMEKCKDDLEREFYIQMAKRYGWTKRVLTNFVEARTYEKYLLNQTNFDLTIPEDRRIQAKLAVKDEYTFDFAELSPEYSEHELELQLVNNIRDFLIEMGGDFTFIGNQYHLMAGNRDLYIDLLLFHRRLRSLVAIELKIGEFEAEYAGKMQLYLTALDEQIKLPDENPSIGIIICKSKDKTYVEYALKNINMPIGVATYQLRNTLPEEMKEMLPEPEEIVKRLKVFEKL